MITPRARVMLLRAGMSHHDINVIAFKYGKRIDTRVAMSLLHFYNPVACQGFFVQGREVLPYNPSSQIQPGVPAVPPVSPGVVLRPHQVEAFHQLIPYVGMARSGIVKIPCGGGKTLLIAALVREIDLPCVIITVNRMTCTQIKDSLCAQTGMASEDVFVVSADSGSLTKQKIPLVFITTYSMLATRLAETVAHTESHRFALDMVCALPHAAVAFDEVHQVPADCFNKISKKIHRFVTWGFSGSLMREDGNLYMLKNMVGPVVYQARTVTLVQNGYLSKISRCIVRFPQVKGADRNPYKLVALGFLVKNHVEHGDKILVFFDRLSDLDFAHQLLSHEQLFNVRLPEPISEKTSVQKREHIFQDFCTSPSGAAILMGKAGDVGINLPHASHAVMFQYYDGSRVQEIQRLGRIQRLREVARGVMYSFVTEGTVEEKFLSNRNKATEGEGYESEVFTYPDLPETIKLPPHIDDVVTELAKLFSKPGN